jgi:hypothetical protein
MINFEVDLLKGQLDAREENVLRLARNDGRRDCARTAAARKGCV